MTYVPVGVALFIIYFFPRITKAIPSPLVAIVVITIFTMMGDYDLRTVGDLGQITQSLPTFLIPNVPFTLETLAIIFPTSLALAIIGLLESLLTASIVDDMTDTKNRESRGKELLK